MIPEVTFTTDAELDAVMTHNFLGWEMGGVEFDDSIFGTNPKLRKLDTTSLEALSSYFEKEHKARAADFQTVIAWIEPRWRNIEPEFISRMVSLFKGHEFPKGKYICYLSLTDCNPRFLEDKTFQMYYKAKVYTRTISHELTHFIFYDYVATKHENIFGNLDPNQGAYWALAELFNNVILSQPNYVELLDNYEDGPYPLHEPHFEALKEMWGKAKDVDVFIPEAFAYLEKALV